MNNNTATTPKTDISTKTEDADIIISSDTSSSNDSNICEKLHDQHRENMRKKYSSRNKIL